MEGRNLTLLTDLYQLTMMQGYFNENKNEQVVFDLFYRKNPFKGAYAIACGLQQALEYVHSIKFNNDDICYLRSLGIFSEPFLNYLKDFKFNGEIYAVSEGTVVFPSEPIIRVEGNIIEAQFIETTLLNIINHQSLIATKASRVKYAAGKNKVLEFGLRRAQGPDAGLYGARATVIGGCTSTSNVLAGKEFGINISGTHGHSWVQSFDTELEAFRAYAKAFPNSCILLVDTYNTLKSGVVNAITVFEELRQQGKLNGTYGIRLDSGDLAYLSKKARAMLDNAGFNGAIISASSDLDEYIITSLNNQGAKIDVWGVGTSLITAKDQPAFGGVYKLVEVDGKAKIKISENIEKVTNPAKKEVYRIYSKETGKIIADLITLHDEEIQVWDDLELFDPISPWKKTFLKGGEYYTRKMLNLVYTDGKILNLETDISKIQNRCENELNTLWDESRRLENPHPVYVDLSKQLWDLKNNLLHGLTEQGGNEL